MSSPKPEYIPQVPPRDWVVTKTGFFFQRRLPETTKREPAPTDDAPAS